jgi:hypothetical protein
MGLFTYHGSFLFVPYLHESNKYMHKNRGKMWTLSNVVSAIFVKIIMTTIPRYFDGFCLNTKFFKSATPR